jgi:hypothetical protein
MASSRRIRHRDRAPGRRQLEAGIDGARPDAAMFGLREAQRQEIARELRYVDEARRAIEAQQNPENREIIRELKAAADRIYDLLNGLEELDSDLPS